MAPLSPSHQSSTGRRTSRDRTSTRTGRRPTPRGPFGPQRFRRLPESRSVHARRCAGAPPSAPWSPPRRPSCGCQRPERFPGGRILVPSQAARSICSIARSATTSARFSLDRGQCDAMELGQAVSAVPSASNAAVPTAAPTRPSPAHCAQLSGVERTWARRVSIVPTKRMWRPAGIQTTPPARGDNPVGHGADIRIRLYRTSGSGGAAISRTMAPVRPCTQASILLVKALAKRPSSNCPSGIRRAAKPGIGLARSLSGASAAVAHAEHQRALLGAQHMLMGGRERCRSPCDAEHVDTAASPRTRPVGIGELWMRPTPPRPSDSRKHGRGNH